MVKKMLLKPFEQRVSTIVVEIFMIILMIVICAGIVNLLYMAAVGQNLDSLTVILVIELFQTLVLLVLIVVSMRVWERHEKWDQKLNKK
ncbi:hypothetical protein H6503_02895 [Candidatus Woesearchaeota archaeon]|nr:hypothetical protein [Candidatus Woesearchaeota archaeon]